MLSMCFSLTLYVGPVWNSYDLVVVICIKYYWYYWDEVTAIGGPAVR